MNRRGFLKLLSGLVLAPAAVVKAVSAKPLYTCRFPWNFSPVTEQYVRGMSPKAREAFANSTINMEWYKQTNVVFTCEPVEAKKVKLECPWTCEVEHPVLHKWRDVTEDDLQ